MTSIGILLLGHNLLPKIYLTRPSERCRGNIISPSPIQDTALPPITCLSSASYFHNYIPMYAYVNTIIFTTALKVNRSGTPERQPEFGGNEETGYFKP
jgi:hypothetical protein